MNKVDLHKTVKKRMKTAFMYIVASILFIPCLAICNEGESLLPNLFGLGYSIVLYLCVKHFKLIK